MRCATPSCAAPAWTRPSAPRSPSAPTPPTTSARAPRCTTRWADRSPAPPTTTPSAEQFDDPTRAPVFAFTIETGHEEESGFHPDYDSPPGHYAKIEREVHAALVALCNFAA
ncbi:hypothetical protein ACFQ1I_39620 [Kitasatospora arboriphila]